MFANICFEKNQNSKIYVYVYRKHDMKWNMKKSSFNLCKFGMLSIKMILTAIWTIAEKFLPWNLEAEIEAELKEGSAASTPLSSAFIFH